jgi:ribonuclease P protein component
MISRLYRFHGRGSLNAVYRTGRTVRGQLMSLKYTETNRRNYRVAVIVSKKVHKSAVVRNRIRRRIFEVVRHVPGINPQAGIVITIFSDQVAMVPAPELAAQVAELLRKSNLQVQADDKG